MKLGPSRRGEIALGVEGSGRPKPKCARRSWFDALQKAADSAGQREIDDEEQGGGHW